MSAGDVLGADLDNKNQCNELVIHSRQQDNELATADTLI